MQRLCSQVGKLASAATVKVVCVPVENGITCPSAVTHGRARQAPAVPPQSASVVHVPKRFDAALVVQRVSPVVPWSLYVLGIGCPTTIGAQTPTSVVVVTFGPQGDVMTVTLVLVTVVVVLVVAQACPAGRGSHSSVMTSLST